MNIVDACKTVHRWHALMEPGSTDRSVPGGLAEAVAVIKAYLEREKADGKQIEDLVLPETILSTREGIRWVMPFVLSAESMEASKRRKANG